MTYSVVFKKIFFILSFMLGFTLFGQTTFAANSGILATFNDDSSSVQNSCVFDIDLSYIVQSGYDGDTGQVELSSPEAGFKKTIPLGFDGTFANARTTVSAPLPAQTKGFTFSAQMFMGRTSTSIRDSFGVQTSSATCVNPQFAADQKLKQDARNQNTTTLFEALSQKNGAYVQFGNRSFRLSGVGSALAGCLGISNSNQLGSIFGKKNNSAVSVDDPSRNQESCGDSLAYAASRLVIQSMSKSAINWALAGNNGNPYYPTDYASFYGNIQSTQVRSFVDELLLIDPSDPSVGSPYGSSYAKSLASQTRNEGQTFAEKYKYTGPDSGFFNDFNKGGWESWYKFVLVPQNNSVGYSLIASQESRNRQETATRTAREELMNNDGFLSQKNCEDKSYIPWSSASEQAQTTAAASAGDPVAKARILQATCKRFVISTPGLLISKQLEQALGTPLRQAEQIDKYNQAVNSIFDNMVTRLVTRGLSSLASSNFKAQIDFSYNKADPNDGTPTGGGFWDQYNSTFDLHRDLPGIIKIQKAYVAQLKKNQDLLVLVFKAIDKMDYSLPGPKKDWANGLQQRIFDTAAAIKQEAQYEMGGMLGNIATLGMRDRVLDGIEGLFLRVFTSVFEFYQNAVTNKFEPSLNPNMPPHSTRMITMIKTKEAYKEIYLSNEEEIATMEDIILQLEDINTKVIDLYKRACKRFIKENPGAKCIYAGSINPKNAPQDNIPGTTLPAGDPGGFLPVGSAGGALPTSPATGSTGNVPMNNPVNQATGQ